MSVRNADKYLAEGTRFAEEAFRRLHSWPETGGEEYRTSVLIGRELQNLGLEIQRPLATAVTAQLPGRMPQTVALRADIDGLPMAEQTNVSYRSRRAGFMHGCGHDVHTAVLLGTAFVLSKIREELPCGVRFLFQPDEEGSGGAEKLIREGALEGAESIFGFHVKPQLPAGTIGVKKGIVHGESRMFRAEIKGKKAHGAKPHLGKDAVYGAAEFVNLCQSILTRYLEPTKKGLISFGTIRGGEAPNVIAAQAELRGIVRGEDSRICDFICEKMNAFAGGLSQVLEMNIQLDFQPGYPALINDGRCIGQVERASAGEIVCLQDSSLTADDFSFYLEKVPGAYFFLGCGYPDRENSDIHTAEFQANPDCIGVGIETLVNLCLSFGEKCDIK